MFVDDVLVRTETEKEHNEIVEEVLKRLEENNLYVKPEKCMWKVKKIGFLGIIIGVTVVLWTSSHILYSLPLHQKGNVSKATC